MTKAPDDVPYNFVCLHHGRIEKFTSQRRKRPMFNPIQGGLFVGFVCGVAAMIALNVGGDSSLTDHKVEGISTYIGAGLGLVAYWVLRTQEKSYRDEFNAEAMRLWAGQEGQTYREQ